MDQDELQTNGQQAETNSADAVNPHASSQVFDISNDNISPISTDAFAYDAEMEPVPRTTPTLATEVDKRSTPPPEEEMLDQKIGSFDATPFAPSAMPVTSATPRPVTPRPPTPQQPRPITPPAPTSTPTINPAVQRQQRPAYQSGPIIVKSQQQVPLKPPIAPVAPSPQRAQSLQEEIAAALHTNFNPDQPTTPPLVPPQSARPQQAVPQFTSQQNAPSPQEPQEFHQETIKPLRTYEGDVAEAMSHKRTSTASIAIAESKKQQGTERVSDEVPSYAGRKITMFIVSLLLLGGGAYGAYYLYSKSALAPVTPVAPQQKAAPSVIPANSQTVLVIASQSPHLIRSLITQEINKPQPADSIKEIIVATKDSSGQLVRVSAPDMIKSLDINAPDILIRSLTSYWMLGVYNSPDNVKSVFVVGTTHFFQNTFAGMLQWEHVMADDLRQFLYPENIEGVLNNTGVPRTGAPINPLSGIDSILPFIGSTTAATTSPAQATSTRSARGSISSSTRQGNASSTQETIAPLKQYATIRGVFEDRIVKNKDVRAFRADNGKIVFLYSFIDNTKLVLTDTESTLAEILSRLEKQAFIR